MAIDGELRVKRVTIDLTHGFAMTLLGTWQALTAWRFVVSCVPCGVRILACSIVRMVTP